MQYSIGLIVFVLWLIILIPCLIIFHYFHNKPQDCIINKYGQPIKHFYGYYPYRVVVHIYIYEKFILVKTVEDEIIINKNSKNYRLHGSIIENCLEVKCLNKIYKIYIYGIGWKYIKDFLEK